MDMHSKFWKACSICKKQIPFSSKYYECSVSTCTGKRTGLVFCTMTCWDAHVPGARHRDAAAVELRSPSEQEFRQQLTQEDIPRSSASASNAAPKRVIINSTNSTTTTSTLNSSKITSSMDNEILVVVSKMKQYIKDKSDMNTSGDVSETLSDLIRTACDEAMNMAQRDGRKTVMPRDFK